MFGLRVQVGLNSQKVWVNDCKTLGRVWPLLVYLSSFPPAFTMVISGGFAAPQLHLPKPVLTSTEPREPASYPDGRQSQLAS